MPLLESYRRSGNFKAHQRRKSIEIAGLEVIAANTTGSFCRRRNRLAFIIIAQIRISIALVVLTAHSKAANDPDWMTTTFGY
ncbi:MAG: hypothetical protein M0Z45_04610 [Actinomycetota bacterium]|nr:hypothetical protein [Actinomycetota bacterium]